MSDKKERTDAPVEAPQSAPDGEKPDSGADGHGPSGHVSRETSKAPSPEAKNKRSSVYIYLLVLFGAAFLMLLLAYFVQQRNSETAISDLRNSMNLSREELMEEIEELTGDNEALQAQIDELNGELEQLRGEKDGLDAQLAAERDAAGQFKRRLDVLTHMTLLEQAIRDEDYDAAAQQARILCQGGLELDLGMEVLNGGKAFDPRERLAEILPLLERRGVLEEGELSIP